MDLTWLDDFLTLAETASFSRAAQRRAVTQPAFSRRIRALEGWVGVPLFDRATHRVRLTEAGERFRAVAGEVRRALREGREEARAAAAHAEASLTFAATHALSLTFFPAWLGRLEAAGPLGAVRLLSNTMAACEQAMLRGEAEFLLCHRHPAVPGPLDAGPFHSVRVGEDVLVPVAGGRAAAALAGASRGELPLLAYSSESGLGRIFTRSRPVERAVALRPVFTSHLAAALRTMAREGRGVAWLPRSLVEDDLARGELVPLGAGGWDVPVEIGLYRPRARLAAAAERFWTLVSRAREVTPRRRRPGARAPRGPAPTRRPGRRA